LQLTAYLEDLLKVVFREGQPRPRRANQLLGQQMEGCFSRRRAILAAGVGKMVAPDIALFRNQRTAASGAPAIVPQTAANMGNRNQLPISLRIG
jgi:membrane-bound lytic murein transglycosylase MltF